MTTIMTPSAESVEEHTQWTDIEHMMTDMLGSLGNQCNADAAAAKRSLNLLNDMASSTDRLKSSSREITNNISNSIQSEKNALANESSELSQQISRVQSLEQEVTTLHKTQSSMIAKRREAEQSIPLHAAVASEQIAELDQIECRHIKTLPKIKNELSLHALMTNIKWDYNRRSNVLAGEVSIPAKSVHRRFVIERDGDLNEFEIAERLWGMIEG